MSTKTAATIALFGSIWGLLEATLGGALHFANVPFTGTIMASVGFAILYAASRSGLRAAYIPLVGITAAAFKFIDPVLFGIPILHITVINPAVAIASQGIAFAVVFRGAPDRLAALAPRCLAAAAVSMLVFNAVSVFAFGWPTWHTEHILNAALVQLPLTAAGATILSKALAVLSDRSRLTLAAGWKAAAAAACAVLAIAIRHWL